MRNREGRDGHRAVGPYGVGVRRLVRSPPATGRRWGRTSGNEDGHRRPGRHHRRAVSVRRSTQPVPSVSR